MILKQYQKTILQCSALVVLAVIIAAFTLLPPKYESNAFILLSEQQTTVSISEISDSLLVNDETILPSITFDDLKRQISDEKFQKEVGLRLLASHLNMLNSATEVITSKRFKKIYESIPPVIRALSNKTDDITYRNLELQIDEQPFLINAVNIPDVSYYYSIAAISTLSVAQVENSEKIILSYRTDDPVICRQTLEIAVDVCMQQCKNMIVVQHPDYHSINGNIAIIYTLLCVSGFIFIIVFLFLMSLFNRKLKTPETTEKKTGLHVQGVIPNVEQLHPSHNSNAIKDKLLRRILADIFYTSHKQYRIVIASMYPNEGKEFICNILCDWLLRKGKECAVITPCFEDGTWWVKNQSVFGSEKTTIEEMTGVNVLIMKVSPLTTNAYPVELISKFDTTFLVCDAERKWLSSDKTEIEYFIKQVRHKPQIILNKVGKSVINDEISKIDNKKKMKTHFAPAERSSEAVVKMEHDIISNDQKAQQIVRKMPNLGVILNKDRQVVYANESITSFLGLSKMDKTLGLRPGELVSCIYADEMTGGCGTSKACKNCGAVNTILRCIDSRMQEEGECSISSFMDGKLEKFNFKISCSPFEVDDNFFVITNLADIKGEEKKRKKLMDDAVESAEFDTDLSGLSEFVGNVEKTGQMDELIDTMKWGAASVTEDIVEQYRLTAAENGELKVQLSRHSAFSMLDNVVRSVRAQDIAKNKKITFALPFPSIYIMTDPDILEQVLRCMLRNAVEAIPIDGVVYIGYEKVNHTVVFNVFNPGIIPEHQQNQIFQKGFTTKENRKGSGTYALKLFGERYLRGQVGFVSAKETGTQFFISLPISEID